MNGLQKKLSGSQLNNTRERSMKTPLLLVLLLSINIIVGILQLDLEKQKSFLKSCIKEYGISGELIRDFFLNNATQSELNQNFKCALKCFMIRTGVMNGKGKYDIEKIMGDFAENPEIADKKDSYIQCNLLEGKNECDMAFLATDCIIRRHFGVDE